MESNLLQHLELNGLIKLEKVNVSKSALVSVTFANLPKLRSFWVNDSYTRTLETPDFSECPAIALVYAQRSGLRSINVRNRTRLGTIWLDENNLTSLDFTGDTILHSVYCRQNQIESIILDNTRNLKGLNCSKNRIKNLYVKEQKEMLSLDCSENAIESLDISGWDDPSDTNRNINCSKNQLKELIVTGTNINQLNCGDNKLTEIDMSNRRDLIGFICPNNPLRYLNMTNILNSPIMTHQTTYNGINLEGNYSLFFICTDSWMVGKYQQYLQFLGIPATVKDECSIAPLILPNPAKDFINIQGIENITLIQLFDLHGQLLQNYPGGHDSSMYIDMTQYSNGVYILNMQTASGRYDRAMKIVKM